MAVARGILLCLALVGPPVARAQEPPVPSLPSLPPSVRVAGLGGAGVAMIGYAGSVFNNPSGLAPVRSLSLEAAYARLPDRSTYTMGAAAVRVGRFNLGTGYQYLRFPADDPVYDNLSWAGTAVYRVMGAAIGTGGRYVSVEDRAGVITRTLTTDASLTLAFFDIAALAVSVQNIGRFALSGDETLDLPTAVRLGFSMNLLDTYSNGRLLATIETAWTAGASRRTIIGLEAGILVHGLGIVVRAGTGSQPEESLLSNTSYGGALVFGRAALDYAYQRRSVLGSDIHLVGVRWTP